MAAGQSRDSPGLAGEQRRRIPHIEPIRRQSRVRNLPQRLVQSNKLRLGHRAVRLVRGKQVRHDALKPKCRGRAKPRQSRGKTIRTHALPAHPGIDLQVNRQPHSLNPSRTIRRMGRTFKLVQLPWLPSHRRKQMLDHRVALPRKDAAHHQHPSLGTQGTRRHTFFNAGDAKPPSPHAHRRRNASGKRMAVSVSLDHGQQLRLPLGKAHEKSIVFFQGTGANLNPAGACWHQAVQASVYRERAGSTLPETLGAPLSRRFCFCR